MIYTKINTDFYSINMFSHLSSWKLYSVLKNGANVCLENLSDLHLPLLTSLTKHSKTFNPFSPEAVLAMARWDGWASSVCVPVRNRYTKTNSIHSTGFPFLCDSGIKPQQDRVLQYLWVDSKGFFQGVAVFPHPEREVPVALVYGGDPLPDFCGVYVSFFYKAVSQLDEELHFLLCLLPKIWSLVMFYYYYFLWF